MHAQAGKQMQCDNNIKIIFMWNNIDAYICYWEDRLKAQLYSHRAKLTSDYDVFISLSMSYVQSLCATFVCVLWFDEFKFTSKTPCQVLKLGQYFTINCIYLSAQNTVQFFWFAFIMKEQTSPAISLTRASWFYFLAILQFRLFGFQKYRS